MSGYVFANGVDMMLVCTKTLDRRRLRRDSVLQRARIVAGATTFDCFLLDKSPAGVRVSVPAPVALPDHVLLELDGQPGIPAWIRWSLGTEAGLAFGPAG
jgi:hypothetical protein